MKRVVRNKYSKEFEEEMINLAPTNTLKELLKVAKKKYGYKINIDILRQYLYKRQIKYKDYDINKVRNMGANVPIGSEYVKPDGMTLVKVSNNKWKYKQRLIYEKYHNVKLTDNDYIIFLDQDRNNFDIRNLKRVNRRESSIVSNQGLYSTNKKLTKKGIKLAKKIIKLKDKEREVKNKMNIWEKMRRKNGLTRVELAKEMGINEERLKEVENNMREMPTNQVDNYISKVNNISKGERNIKIAEARNWYEQVNLKELMKEFGYENQSELAKTLGVDPSSISVWFNKKNGSKKIGTNSLLKLYYFFNNEFNKKLENKNTKNEPNKVQNKLSKKETNTLYKWYNVYDLKKAVIETGKKQKELAKEIGIAQSCLCTYISKQVKPTEANLRKLYDYFNKLEEEKEEPTVSVDTTSIIEEQNIPNEQSFEPSDFDDLVYDNYYSYIPNDNDIIYVETPTSQLKEDTTKTLIEENKELKQRLARYETLIDIIVKNNKLD